MARLDIPVSDNLAEAVRFEADARGQSISEFVRRKISVGVEPGPYRFDGMRGPSLVRDLVTTYGGQAFNDREADEAHDRLHRFTRWAADGNLAPLNFAPQTTTSASQIVPPGYRPDARWLEADRPLYSACEKGAISGSASFLVARTQTADGVVPASRTEGNQPATVDPTFANITVSPTGLAGMIDVTRELVDGASPGGDLVMLRLLAEDWTRRAEEQIYTALNTAQGGTITGDFAANGAQAAVSTTPATNLANDTRKAVLRYAVLRRRKARNMIVGRAALDYLGALSAQDGVNTSTGDDTALASVFGCRVNASVNDFATGTTDMRVAILGSDDVFAFTSPLQEFRFDEQAGPALVRVAIWAYLGVGVVRPRGVSSIRFT
jgi:hypothetical protein